MGMPEMEICELVHRAALGSSMYLATENAAGKPVFRLK
jgi:hypothetical protein